MAVPQRPERQGHRRPDYLAAARVTRARPKQVVTYDINPKAVWSDGTPIGYRDFRALWRACGGRDPAFEVTASTGYERVESVERGRGDRQVVVTFARPFGEWRDLFSPLYPARAIATPAAWNTAWANRLPVTAGPFRPERVDRMAETVSVVRNPSWWGRRAKLDRVVFRYLARDAMPEAFASGEIDGFDVGADAAAYRRAATVPGATVRGADGPDVTQLTLNGAAPALTSAAVRRALMLAIDRRPSRVRPCAAWTAPHGRSTTTSSRTASGATATTPATSARTTLCVRDASSTGPAGVSPGAPARGTDGRWRCGTSTR